MKWLKALMLFTLASVAMGDKITLKVEGMTCGGCVQGVTDDLKKISGVDPASIKVSLKHKSATFDVTGVKVDDVVRQFNSQSKYKLHSDSR